MANNSPLCTVFVDFRSAFDQLWFDGYVGKLSRLGIPAAYVAWIKEWLTNRRGYIDIQGTCSRWFPIKRGGPQGSSLTPSVFITYHSDMSDAFPMVMSFLFADDVAATMAGQMGIKYTDQCIDLEKRLASFFDNLEYYSVLSVQPINYKKTHAMWTARAVSYLNPMPILKCGEHIISWTNQFKYLGYWISTKLGWSSLINYTLLKIRQRTTLVNVCKYAGVSSNEVRRILFSTQQIDLSHAYFTCLKRVYRCLQWEDFIFSILYNECSLDVRCFKYWGKYLAALGKSEDGQLLLEQIELWAHRQSWLNGHSKIMSLRKNKRLIDRNSVWAICLGWCSRHNMISSIPAIDHNDIHNFIHFPETF
ncbi:unnamed protein product [Rotaria socialis]|uniref:Reverse transcriptase domain-containing protein n=1 Tax=Rotaria socialis TaxID=392032 RepID=A0A817YIS0_9BILA|nr:unnamed protein product [Rotaria socialis]